MAILGSSAAAGSVSAALDTVGGHELVAAFGALDAHGTVVIIGRSSGDVAAFAPALLESSHGRYDRSIRTRYGEAIDALVARTLAGQAVLDLTA